jgi:Tfp pilus assembly protein PilX
MQKKPRTNKNNKKGMALVTCLLIMVVLAMIGIGITTDSTIEIKINGNFKDKAVSFQNADTGTAATPEIIEDNLDNPRSGTSYTYSGTSPTIIVNTATFATIPKGTTLNDVITIETPAITTAGVVNKQKVKTVIDISKTGHLAAGNALQMAAGYEGLGKGSAGGGYHAFYLCNSTSPTANNTTTTNEINYRHVSK